MRGEGVGENQWAGTGRIAVGRVSGEGRNGNESVRGRWRRGDK